MKTRFGLLIFLFTTIVMSACQEESEDFFYHYYDQVSVKMDFQPKYYCYNGEFRGSTFRLGGDYREMPVAIDSLFFDGDGYARGRMSLQAADREFLPLGKVFTFDVKLTADTTLFFRQAVDDDCRMIAARDVEEALDGTRYVKVNLESVYSPDNVVFTYVLGGNVYDIGNTRYLWFNSEKMKTTVKFYNYNDSYPLDTTVYRSELTLTDYDFSDGKPLRVIRPLGSPIELYKDENADQYTTLKASIKYNEDQDAKFYYTYGGDVLSSSANRIRADNLDGTLKVHRIKQIEDGSQEYENDTVVIYSESRQFQPGEQIEFLYMGGEVTYNEYMGDDPDDRASFFVRLAAGEDVFETKSKGPYDIKIYLTTDGSIDGLQPVKEFKNLNMNQFSEPFQLHFRGDIIPADIYDKAVAEGQLPIYDADWNETEEVGQCRLKLVVRTYEAGTDKLCFNNRNEAMDLGGYGTFLEEPFEWNEDWTAWLFPQKLNVKCIWIKQSEYRPSTINTQGNWE